MHKLILWILNQFSMGYSQERIIAKLEMLEAVARAVPSYQVEDIIERIIDKMEEEEDNAE